MKEKTAIDKLRNIVVWADNMDEHFNDKVRSPMDWIILANIANIYHIEFIDELDDSNEEHAEFMKSANHRLGYELF